MYVHCKCYTNSLQALHTVYMKQMNVINVIFRLGSHHRCLLGCVPWCLLFLLYRDGLLSSVLRCSSDRGRIWKILCLPACSCLDHFFCSELLSVVGAQESSGKIHMGIKWGLLSIPCSKLPVTWVNHLEERCCSPGQAGMELQPPAKLKVEIPNAQKL